MRNLGGPLLLVSDDLVRRSITAEECVEAVEDGFRLLAGGAVANTYAQLSYQEGVASIHLYAASVPGYGVGAKILGAYQRNPDLGEPYIHATVVLLDPDTGKPEAVLDGRYLTALRTAAAAALSTKYLVRQDSQVLGILGTGLQARTHLLCHLVIHPFKRVVLWGRTPEHVRAYLREMAPRVAVPIDSLPSAEAVCGEADVISCTTRARRPLFSVQAVRPGSHITVAGPMGSRGAEVPLDLLPRGHLFVDSREEFRKLWQQMDLPAVEAELGEVILGQVTRRPTTDAITIFKPVGMAFEDVVTARIIVNRVRHSRAGQIVTW